MILFTLVSQVLLLIITIQFQFPWAVLGRLHEIPDLNLPPPEEGEGFQVLPENQAEPFTPSQQQHYAALHTSLNVVPSRISDLSSSDLPGGAAQVHALERQDSSGFEGSSGVSIATTNRNRNVVMEVPFRKLRTLEVATPRDEPAASNLIAATGKRKAQTSDLVNSHVPSVATLSEQPAQPEDKTLFWMSLMRSELFQFDFQAETRYLSSLKVVPSAPLAIERPLISVGIWGVIMPPKEAGIANPNELKKLYRIVRQYEKSQASSVLASGPEPESSMKSAEKEKENREMDVEDSTKQDIEGAQMLEIGASKWWYLLDENAMNVLQSHRHLFPVENYLVLLASKANWEESHYFHLMHTYLEWMGDPSKEFFMPKSIPHGDLRVYTNTWKEYFKSSLFSIGNFDPKTADLQPAPIVDFESLKVDLIYDRWRWMKQVQKAYDMPLSRKVLCEGLMLSGYAFAPRGQSGRSDLDRVNSFERKWKAFRGIENRRYKASALYYPKLMRNMAEVTERTWVQKNLYKNHINQLYQNSWTPDTQRFWNSLFPGMTDAMKNTISWNLLFPGRTDPMENTIQKSELNWEQHEIIWEKLNEKFHNHRSQNQLAQDSGNFKADELWVLVYGVKNAEKQLQIGMDQLYSIMTLNMNRASARILESNRDRAIKRLQENIIMYNVIGRHLVDISLKTIGLIDSFEKEEFLSKERLDELVLRLKDMRTEKTMAPLHNSKRAKGKRPQKEKKTEKKKKITTGN